MPAVIIISREFHALLTVLLSEKIITRDGAELPILRAFRLRMRTPPTHITGPQVLDLHVWFSWEMDGIVKSHGGVLLLRFVLVELNLMLMRGIDRQNTKKAKDILKFAHNLKLRLQDN